KQNKKEFVVKKGDVRDPQSLHVQLFSCSFFAFSVGSIRSRELAPVAWINSRNQMRQRHMVDDLGYSSIKGNPEHPRNYYLEMASIDSDWLRNSPHLRPPVRGEVGQAIFCG